MQKVKVNVRKWKWKAVAKLLTCCCHAKSESKREKVKVRMWCFYAVTYSTWGIAAEYFVSSLLSMKAALMYLPHRKQNCRCTTAEVPLLGRIIFSKIVSQCFDKSFKLDPSCLAPHNDRLLPLQHNWDLMHVGKIREVVDVQMDVNVVAMLLPFSWKILHTYLAVQEKELPLSKLCDKDIPSYQQVFFKGSTGSRNLSTWFGL